MAKQGIYESASGSFALGTGDMQDIQNVEVFWLWILSDQIII